MNCYFWIQMLQILRMFHKRVPKNGLGLPPTQRSLLLFSLTSDDGSDHAPLINLSYGAPLFKK
jgi:hypothetical protein